MKLIRQLCTDWQHLSHSPASRTALVELAVKEPLIKEAHVEDLGSLLSTRGGHKIVRVLLRSQTVHPLISRALLQALLPGLLGIAKELAWGNDAEWRDRETFLADLFEAAWIVIIEWQGQDRPYAGPDLLSAIKGRLKRRMFRYRQVAKRTPFLFDDHYADPKLLDTGSHPLEAFARTIEVTLRTCLEPVDAGLFYGAFVLGYSFTELAKMSGRTRRFVSAHCALASQSILA